MIETVQEPRRRAGFWRRAAAFLIDMAVVLVPLQDVLAVLFAQTNGAFQGSFGLKFTTCMPVEKLPDGLQPPPPVGYNRIVDCKTSLFGFDTARTLTVAKETQTGNTRSGVFQTYALGADGMPKDDVLYVNWIAVLALFAYLILLESRLGATLGKRCVSVKVIDTSDETRVGLPARKATTRQLSKLIGSVPAIVFGLILFSQVGGVEDLQTVLVAWWFNLASLGAWLIGAAWALWIIVSLVRKKDPVYDRLAGTAVVLK
ncbi:RDD family protein [Allomesorhizobium camelthorni]|uniref:RDD family protein n=1 Tax=Allomesorhizobium camelthorni TaxID=475069 RepID=A0A6G4W4X4_9HYPH|nr:RDD family protein [Mesorhizobium camelthorni]NGO49594.1 RDD family protein [Mesorhizobium camelthorni]